MELRVLGKISLAFQLRKKILNFSAVFLTAVKLMKYRNYYLFAVTGVKKMKWFLSLMRRCHFQPLVTYCHSCLEMAPGERQKPFHFLHISDSKQTLIVSHEVPFLATSDCRSRVAGNGTELGVKTIELC